VDLTEHADYIEQQALNIAIRAKAVKQCFFHPDVIIDLGDPDAENALTRWERITGKSTKTT
jgi:hypothetical protein